MSFTTEARRHRGAQRHRDIANTKARRHEGFHEGIGVTFPPSRSLPNSQPANLPLPRRCIIESEIDSKRIDSDSETYSGGIPDFKAGSETPGITILDISASVFYTPFTP